MPLAVIDSALAARLWPGEQAVGRFFVHERSGVRYEVAGVVAPIVERTTAPTVATLFEYQALDDDNGLGTLQFVARADAAADDQRAALLGVIRQVFPDPLRVDVRSTNALVAGERMQEIMGGRLFSWFGAAAALLGLAGVYGLVAFSILRQRRETGIRLVLGASARSVRWRVIRQAMAPVIVGAATGLLLMLAVGEVVAALVAGAVPLDLAAYVGAATGFIGVALLAAIAASRMPTSTHGVIDLLRAD